MGLRSVPLALAAVVILVSGVARAGNPSTDGRRGAVATAAGQATVCEGGGKKGDPCNDDSICTGGGTCTGVSGTTIAARGVLTVIADTRLSAPSGGDPFLETNPPPAACDDCEQTAQNNSFTLLLEFTLDGKAYAFAETFAGVGSQGVSGFGSEVQNGGGLADWNTGASETELVNCADTVEFKLRWGLLPPAAAAGVAKALGQPGKVPVVLASNEIPVCSDPAACNLGTSPDPDCFGGSGPANTQYARHSGGSDSLGSIRRFKVDIGFVTGLNPAP